MSRRSHLDRQARRAPRARPGHARRLTARKREELPPAESLS